MILVHPKSRFSTPSCRAAKRVCSVAVSGLMILIATMLLPAGAEFAVAQDIVGRIVGTVTDSSGAAVPDIKVTIVNEATQAGRDVTSPPRQVMIADIALTEQYSDALEGVSGGPQPGQGGTNDLIVIHALRAGSLWLNRPGRSVTLRPGMLCLQN